MKKCVVCKSKKIFLFLTLKELNYWQCDFCQATFLDPKNFLSHKKEKEHYLKHNNIINDPSYRKFVSNLLKPIKDKISISDLGLDYGCGYAPALADMLRKKGFKIELYDPFFFKNNNIFHRKFKFITCSEVAEHFFNPYEEFSKIDKLMDNNSWLVIMTTFMTERHLFENWHYRRDPTHVVFYKKKTFQCIADKKNWQLTFPLKNIALFNKK